MNIACDARALTGPLTGVGVWTTAVMGGLSAGGDRVLLAAPRAVGVARGLATAERLAASRLPIPGTIWLHTLLPVALERSPAEVFVASLAIVPRRCPIPAVAVVHDLTPRTHPSRHTLANRFCFNAYLEESLERAARVVAVSRATEEALATTFPWLGERLRRIPNGVDSSFSPPSPGDDGEATRARYSAGRRYLLHLGTIEPRKGIVDLVAAWERLHELVADPPDLVVAGGRGWSAGPILRRVARSTHAERIHLAGYVEREDARRLLRHAEVFVLASEAEGFGLPLAEAIACSTPCVASDIAALREVAGEAALFAPAGEPEALAAALARALTPEVADELRRRAARRAPDLGWAPAVEAWRRLLGEVVAGSD